MMNLHIVLYKPTGKFYLEHDMSFPQNMPLFDDKFRELIEKTTPGIHSAGFVVISDNPGGEGFHNHLYRKDEYGHLI